MSHGHDHSHSGAGAGEDAEGRRARRRALAIAFGLTAGFMGAEVVGGLLTGSLALLADAGHMLSDALSLAVALFAVRLADRPATPDRTFGFKRAEILAALFNGVTLILISAWIFYEAISRLSDPPEVLGGPMLVVALLGLAVNFAAFRVLHAGSGSESINMSAAIRHVVADIMGSVGVLIAAGVILLTGFEAADPIISFLIALLILFSAWPVLRDASRVLLEAAPRDIDVARLGTAIAGIDGVRDVHDLHVWTITSGFPAMSAHVVVAAEANCHRKRLEIEALLDDRYSITHTTLQVDHAATNAPLQLARLDSGTGTLASDQR
ncbi:cation transporter [Thermoleophilia bacterium SCSIO 60948]|nr:cation transporter [Thermoleophilia bacterium SCSIO 60948]